MTFKPTPEQEAIIEAGVASPCNLMISALAGCAKTSSLRLLSEAFVKAGQPIALATAFNVKIRKELEAALPQTFTVKTLNGLGHSAWGRAIGKNLQIEDRKLGKLITAVAKDANIALTQDQWDQVRQLVNKARGGGLIPSHYPIFLPNALLPDRPETWADIATEAWLTLGPEHLELARAVLIESCKQAFSGVIDFDDQIYMSTMFGGIFPKFPKVLVDEAQDLSPLNHIQIARCLGRDTRLVVCGDPKQAIYAFRGADTSSMAKMRRLRPADSWRDLSLSLTFRCPHVVVRRQQDHAPGYRAHESNAQGTFLDWLNPRGTPEPKLWGWAEVEALKPSPASTVAVACRNNAPLLSLAFKLIRQRIAPYMLGRDIGKGLVALSKKIAKDDSMPIMEFAQALNDWAAAEAALARANDREEKIAGIQDRAQCLEAVIESAGVTRVGELREALTALFSRETGRVTLGTGHRLKGLEFDVVLHLDPWRIPSKFARQAAEEGRHGPMEQELNLRYVIETRARHVLTQASLEDFE